MHAPNVLLNGSDRLGVAIGDRLVRAGCVVTTLAPERLGSAQFDDTALRSASVLLLAADDDAWNVDLALTARRLRPDLPLVVRLFDEALALYLTESVDRVVVLSMSGLSAPAFAEATLRAIAARDARGPHAAPSSLDTEGPRRRSRVVRDRVLVRAIVGFVAIVMAFTLFFAKVLHLSSVDALYFVWTTMTTVGYGDIALREASAAVKIVGMVQMFAGTAFVAVLLGLFTDWVFSRRFEMLMGRVRVRGRGHIVIAGGGNVGVRVAGQLGGKAHRLVFIERNADNKNTEALRSMGHHVIIGDATRRDTLGLARVAAATAVLSVTDSDAVNLQVALLVRAQSRDVPLVIRIVSPELSAHVTERGEAVAVSPIDIASEAFSTAALRVGVGGS